jgi:RNA polymerase sigma-70 factor (ECF subfamily)
VPFIAWLTRIAANAIVQRAKRAGREQTTSEVPEEPSPDLIECRAMLFQLVDSLPPDQKKVIVKRFVEERSIREIAQEMRRTEGAIKQLQFRALVNLRDRMEGAYE